MINKTELIKELRALTSAGMKDCKDALEESNFDLNQAVDLIKIKGLNIVSGREGKIASEGLIGINFEAPNRAAMVEVNSQTDFVSNSQEFRTFVNYVAMILAGKLSGFSINDVESVRQKVVSSTKENVVVRRWQVEEAQNSSVKVFTYLHSNQKIGVLLTLKAPSEETSNFPEFKSLGEDLAMQIAAMNPLSVSSDRLDPADKERQKIIFETQLMEMKKPEVAWPKIMEGKFRKWFSEVCLLEQESVVVPKTTVLQVINNVEKTLGGQIMVVNFVRFQVGEGLSVRKDNLSEEVAKLTDQSNIDV